MKKLSQMGQKTEKSDLKGFSDFRIFKEFRNQIDDDDSSEKKIRFFFICK